MKTSVSVEAPVMRRNAGFSLVELMVALLVGLLITLGAFQLFVTSRQNFDQASAIMERQETLRYLVDSISYDVRSADFIGVLSSNNARLSLTFNKQNSYCNGADKYRLDYYRQTGSTEIIVELVCDGAAGTTQPVVVGVGSIEFNYSQPATASSGAYSTIPTGPVGLMITITLVDEKGRLQNEEFTFRVANRTSIGRALEYEVGP